MPRVDLVIAGVEAAGLHRQFVQALDHLGGLVFSMEEAGPRARRRGSPAPDAR
uniref:Uncharacterized protein n=1 Tax=Polymyxa graminis TaxID=70182 RepID=Q8T320_9EUKA|nr:hypothetical protein [Polymyxa graminis]